MQSQSLRWPLSTRKSRVKIFNVIQRSMFLVGALLMVSPEYSVVLMGLLVLFVALIWQLFQPEFRKALG